MRPAPLSACLGKVLRRVPAEIRPTLLLLLLPVTKWFYTVRRPEVSAYGIDGGYYLDIAQNVAAGAGFVTDISPFNQGLPELPYPSPVYPVWPTVLGWVGRLVPLEQAAYWLPALLYFVALIPAWALGRAWSGGRRLRLSGMEIHGGHALVVLFAFNFQFYESTSMPYTEGLAFSLLLTALWRMHSVLRIGPEATGARAIAAGAEAGLWCALLFLIRSQFLLFSFALLAAFPWILRTARARVALSFGLACSATAVIIFLPQALFLSGLTESWFLSYLRFDQFQATAVLPRLDPDFRTSGVLHFLIDRLKGVLISQIPGGHDSYSRGFHALAYAPLVLAGLLAASPARRERVAAWMSVLRGQSVPATPWIFALAFAFGTVLSLHNIHLTLWHEWHFGQRQALVAAFLIALSWIGLLDLGRAGRIGAAVLLGASLVLGMRVVVRNSVGFYRGPWSYVRRHASVVELMQKHSPSGRAARTLWVVPADWGKMLAAVTPGAAFHEYQVDAEEDQIEAIFEKLGGEYLVVDRSARLSETVPPPSDERFLLIQETSSARIFRYLTR